MYWTKPYINILLYVSYVLVAKGLPAGRVDVEPERLKTNFRRMRVNENYIARAKVVDNDTKFQDSNLARITTKLRSPKYESFNIRPGSNTERRSDLFKSSDTNKPISKTRELIDQEIHQAKHFTNKNGAKRASLRSSYTLNQLSFKFKTINDKTSVGLEDEHNNDYNFNRKKRTYNKQASTHGIVKRDIFNTSSPTQPGVIPSTDPPLLFLPPPPVPQFNIPPVCRGRKSCSSRCTGYVTEWRSDERLECYCDTACYEVFNDCCTDYTKYCGQQRPSDISIKKFKWTCESLGHFRSNQHCLIGEGLWMVSQCADNWPHDRIRENCETATTSLRKAPDITRYIPAVNGNYTYRNHFCAKCNGIAGDLEYFPVEIKTNIIPPEHYNFSQKLDFLLLNGAEFSQDGLARPKTSQARRYCLMSIAESCSGNTTSESCTNGPVAPVSGFNKQFKNYDCALCNDPTSQYSCFPSVFAFNCRFSPPKKFLLNLDYSSNEEDSIFTIQNPSCRNGLIYDETLQECAENLPAPSKEEDRIRVLAWFSPSKDFQFTESDFKTVMKQYFAVEHSQIYNVSIEIAPGIFELDPTPDSTILYHLVSSVLLFTPDQSFDILFKSEINSSRLQLRSFVHFEKPLIITLKNITYTIIKTTSRPLSCVTQKVYTPQEYEVLDEQRIRIKQTDIAYSKSDYYGQINGSIILCEVYSSNCEKTETGLTKDDFTIYTNLSLYQKNTGKIYQLGQYDVSNNSIALCDLEHLDIPTCSSANSCKGRCSNHTEWRTEMNMRCSCDPDCYEVFNDCCSDYTKYCGAQKPTVTRTKKYNFTCEKVGHFNEEHCTVGEGMWMVTQCRHEWPYDTFRTKCEAPVDKLTYSSSDLYGYLPVISHDNITFRNLYCAICNDKTNYEGWPLDIETSVIPPESYNITEKIRFLLSVGAKFPDIRGPWGPGANQARRYCVQNIIDSCPSDKTVSSCNHGNVAIVSLKGYDNFKNTHCAVCHSVPSEILTCFPEAWKKICRDFFPQSFALVLDSSRAEIEFHARLAVHDDKCGESGKIYDEILQVCRISWLSSPQQNAQERFFVYAWLEPPRNSQNNSFTPIEFQESLAKYLNVSRQQVFDINVTTVLKSQTNTLLFYLASSTIAIAPEQSLELLSVAQNTATSQTAKLRHFIYFSQSFTLQMNGLPYTVAKTTSRPLACVGKKTYTPDEYTLQDQERVLIISSNKTYAQFEYYRENPEQLEVKRGNITVCEKYISAKCNGTIIHYTSRQYTLMVNLSIYVNETSSLHNYGEYEILANQSVGVCVRVKENIITGARKTIRDNVALGYITFIFFLLSILSLTFLLVTYIIFPQLRTLPGKNLMNLAAGLLLFEIFWLPSSFSEVRSHKPTCTAMAVMEHYFLMAFFVSMSVIAFHTCKVFARSLPAPKMSQSHERKLFCMYLALVWLLPGIFVAICVVLDDQDVVKLGYGESEICWLTENNAFMYFVTIPIGVMLSFNIIAFIIAAVYLRKHGQNNLARQASGNRRSNLSIYARLSTLMGFTWLFGLLALVVTSTTVFWYFFVISTSLQGVLIALAFVVNAKTFGLYRKGYNKYSSGSGTPNTTRNHLTMVNDTKL